MELAIACSCFNRGSSCH